MQQHLDLKVHYYPSYFSYNYEQKGKPYIDNYVSDWNLGDYNHFSGTLEELKERIDLIDRKKSLADYKLSCHLYRIYNNCPDGCYYVTIEND